MIVMVATMFPLQCLRVAFTFICNPAGVVNVFHSLLFIFHSDKTMIINRQKREHFVRNICHTWLSGNSIRQTGAELDKTQSFSVAKMLAREKEI